MGEARTWRLAVVVAATLMLCLLFVLAGCGSKEEDKGDDRQVVTEETRQAFDLETGQHFDFSLESNPTTGYTWQATQSPDEKIVRLVSNRYVAPSDDLVGAPGEEVWQFQAVAVGSTSMVLEYAQAWDDETPPAKRYTFTFNVVQADNEINQSFSIEAGKALNITLETNPSAGYAWSMTQQPDAKVLKLISNDVTGGGTAGAAQQQVWKFEGVGAGSTSFVLEYKGPGENAPVERKDNVKVTVTAPPTPVPAPPKTYNDPAVSITAERGEVFILQVNNEAGTGYNWRLAEEINTSMFKFMGSESRILDTQPGSPSVTEFTFEALGPGQQTFKLGLYGPDDDEPSRTVEFNVTAK